MENIDITLEQPNISSINDVLTGPQGPKGDTGEPGRDGVSPTINVGTVTTLTAGSEASVSNSGSTTNVILDFGIPTGPQGIQGPAGADGVDGTDGVSPTISIGNTTTLDPNSPATVTNVGTNTDVILDFGIPQGKQGTSDNCLSVPTVVGELPENADPKTFYFVPKKDDETTTSGSSLTLNITKEYGRLENFQIDGYLDTSTPGTLTPLTGNITIVVNATTYTVNIDSTYLAKVNDTYDYIYYDNTEWKLARNIGYIASYAGETITTDYISTSGTLTTGDEVYFVKEEPEEILIEDATITDVLNQIMSTKFEEGTSTITSSANATVNLEIKYYSYVEDDQYDKYAYVIVTSNYEKIGGGSGDIADGSVTTAKLDDSSVTTPKISNGSVTGTKIASSTVTSNNIDWTTMGVIGDYSLTELETPFKDWNGDTIYKKTVDCGALPNNSFKNVSHNISNLKNVVSLTGVAYNPTTGTRLVLPGANPNADYSTSIAVTNTDIQIGTGTDRSAFTQTFITVSYTKN